jgi:hypothetical protein
MSPTTSLGRSGWANAFKKNKAFKNMANNDFFIMFGVFFLKPSVNSRNVKQRLAEVSERINVEFF